MKRLKKPMFTSSDWTIAQIDKGWDIISKHAKEKYGWEGFPVQFEILDSAQFIDMQSSVFLPTFYSHWSFGKATIEAEDDYNKGNRGLPYECIINTSPSICYIHENNSMCMQLLVTAHAAIGHNHFFKNNYLFKEWTQPDFIADYMLYAKHYIKKCEEKYGVYEVSETIDTAHLFIDFSVFKTKSYIKTDKEIDERRTDRQAELFASYDPVIDGDFASYRRRKSLSHALSNYSTNENILYFFENATNEQSPLKPWQKEIFSIIRTTAQYFYPQRQTKMMNEGFASFAHYTLMYDLYEMGYINEGYFLEFLHSHTGVVCQHDFNKDKPYTFNINPYYLGFEIFKEIRRVCENPTEEDKQFIPAFCGRDWVETVNYVVANYRDESLIREFLTPNLIRKLKLFSIETDEKQAQYSIGAIQQQEDYDKIRDILAEQYSWTSQYPDVEIRCAHTRFDEIETAKKELSEDSTGNHGLPTLTVDTEYLKGAIENLLIVRFTEDKGNKFNSFDLDKFCMFLKACWRYSVVVSVYDKDGTLTQSYKVRGNDSM